MRKAASTLAVKLTQVESPFWPALLLRVLTEPRTAGFYQPNPKQLHCRFPGNRQG